MLVDQDIISMFKEKNKAILIQNLKYDTERNIDSLMETLNNIINNDFDIAKKNIKSIFDGYDFDLYFCKIDNLIDSMKDESYKIITEIIQNKKNTIITDIDSLCFEEEEMKNYYSLIDNTTKTIQITLENNVFNDIIQKGSNSFFKLIEKLKNREGSDLIKNRINDYISIRLYKKLEDKMLSAIRIRDNNLINKGKESYDKYQEITKKTIRL